MSDAVIWTVILGMGVANFTIRFLPIAVVSRMTVPRPVMRWLSFVPVSVMGALVASEVLRPGGGDLRIWPIGPHLTAAAFTALAYRLTRSFVGAALVGMASFVALRVMLGA